MTTSTMFETVRLDTAPRLRAGDVIEITTGDDAVSALVLLASCEAVIYDTCDGSMPRVAKPDEMVGVRVFRAADA